VGAKATVQHTKLFLAGAERMATIVLEGYLQKQGHIFQSWNRRYFILTTTKLSYYSDSTSKKRLKGEYLFTASSYIRRCDPIDRHIYLLELHADGTGGTELLIEAENEDTLLLWQTKINNILSQRVTVNEPTSKYQLHSSSDDQSLIFSLSRDLQIPSSYEFLTKMLIQFDEPTAAPPLSVSEQGMEYLPSQLQHQPIVHYETAPRDPETHYLSLFLLDLDSPSPSEPLYRDFIQWVVVNISQNIPQSGEVIVPYLPPCPPYNSGSHRSLYSPLSVSPFSVSPLSVSVDSL
jgi:hypothetical protein